MNISAANNESVTRRLHEQLWYRFGRSEYPAEWDGHNYGGGKLSQRYWEYFKAIEFLNLTSDSVVLDIGGGSPETGVGFFASLLATAVHKVVVMDSNINTGSDIASNVEIFPHLSNDQTLSEVFKRWPEITHVSCVSVLEHVPPNVRQSIMKGINEGFTGNSVVLTLEFHPRRTFFEYQLTARTLSEALAPLERFFPTRVESSPVLSENAFASTRINIPDKRSKYRFWKRWISHVDAEIPCWHPVAVAFERRMKY